MKNKQIQDFFNEHYGEISGQEKPDDEIIEKFFEGEVAFRPQGSWYEDEDDEEKNTGLDTATSFEDSGTMELVIDTLTLLNSDPKWVIITDSGTESLKVIMKVPEVSDYYLIIRDLRRVMEASQSGMSKIPTIHKDILWVSNQTEDPDEIGFADIKEWEQNTVPGCWFDSDGDEKGKGWGYTPASKFLNEHTGFQDKSYLSYVIYLEDEIMITILNWMGVFYKNLFKVVGVKV